MKKNKKTALMAAVLTGTVMLTGCDIGHEEVQDVYGPPLITESKTAESDTTEYDPAKDDIQDVYGPPSAGNAAETPAE